MSKPFEYLDERASFDRLRRMVELAGTLRQGASSTTSVTLSLLCALENEDLEQLSRSRSLSKENCCRLSASIGRPVEMIGTALRRSLLPDLIDYSGFYSIRMNGYLAAQKSENLDARFRASYGDIEKVIPFLYHADLIVWEVDREVPAMRLDGDPRFIHLFEGFLVAEQRSFETTVEMLAATQRIFPKWEKFWKWF